MNRSVSLTANASPAGKNATTDESSFLSMSINFRGNGFAPEVVPEGDAVADKAGEGGRLLLSLPMLAVLVILRVAIGPSDTSLIFEVEVVLAGEVPVPVGGGFILMTPAATPPARGKSTAPEPTEEGTGGVEEVVLGVFLAFS